MSIQGNSGQTLGVGKKLLYADYDIEVDARPVELTREFLDDYDWAMDDVDEEWEEIVEDARNFTIDEIVHVNAVAREENVDPVYLDDERLEAQSENGVLKMSNLWDGRWRDLRAGTCQERAITLHSIYNELGIESAYHEGTLKLESGRYGGHGWTTVGGKLISDPSISGDGVLSLEDADRYAEREVYVI